MSVTKAVNFDDLRRMAKRRLPKIAFDFLEGGVDGEEGIAHNGSAFSQRKLVPRYGVDVSRIDTGIELFGRRYALPFGIAPTGANGLFRIGTDAMLARAAKVANVPFVLSGVSTTTIEEMAAIAPDLTWFQLYVAKDRAISWDMVKRAELAGFPVLVVTIDIPSHAKRERNLRNGFAAARPNSPALKTKIEALSHPGWMLEYLRGPHLTAPSWAKYAPKDADGPQVLAFVGSQMPAPVTWDDVAHLRKIWPRALVIKGLMHPADVLRAANLGCDGVVVSNHGGRQLDRAPSPIDVLPAIRDAAGGSITLLYDSGIRRGADIATALATGAKCCFVGRWTLYAAAAGGEIGIAHALSMIKAELESVMAQIGAPNVAALGPDMLMWDDDLRRNARP